MIPILTVCLRRSSASSEMWHVQRPLKRYWSAARRLLDWESNKMIGNDGMRRYVILVFFKMASVSNEAVIASYTLNLCFLEETGDAERYPDVFRLLPLGVVGQCENGQHLSNMLHKLHCMNSQTETREREKERERGRGREREREKEREREGEREK